MHNNEETRPLVIIMQGGAMRAAFGAGVLYEFAQQNVFPHTIASMSAGIPTAAYYVARQCEHLKAAWTGGIGPELVSITNLFMGKPVFDIRYFLNEMARKKYPLSAEAVAESPTRLIMPIFNYVKRRIELRSNRDPDFLEHIWSLLHVSLVVHGDHILRDTPFEQYVDGAVDPFALFKEDFFPTNARVVVIWNESDFKMHFLKYLGHKVFMLLQMRNVPETLLRVIETREDLVHEGVRMYEQFCAKVNPTIVIPERRSALEGFDILRNGSTHLASLFEHGRAKGRDALLHLV